MATKKPAKETGGTKELSSNESARSLGFLLKRMERLAGSAGFQNLVISPTKTKTLVSAQLPGTTIERLLPEKLEGLESAWSFEYPKLLSAVVGRKSENLSIEDGSLVIKDNRYQAKLMGSETSTVPRVEAVEAAKCEFTASGEVQALLRDALTAVNLTKSLAALPDITVHVSLKKKSAHIVTWDKSQLVSYMVANTTGQTFEFTLPLPKAQAIFKEGLGDATLKISDSALFIQDGGFKMSSSLPPAEEASGVPVERVLERALAMREMKLPKKVAFRRADLQAFLENAKALSRTSANLKFEVAGAKTTVTINADGSSIKAGIASDSKETFDFLLDINYVNAIMAKSKDDVQIMMDDSSFIFKSGDTVYAAVLTSAPEETKKKGKTKASADEEED